MSKALHPGLSLLFGALALPLSGCASYVSDYVPPDRGRARVLFRDDEAIASLPPMDPACLRELEGNPEGPSFRIVRGGVGARVVYWVPVVHGPTLHLHSPGNLALRPGQHGASGGGRRFASPGMRGSGGRVSSGSRSSGNSGSNSGGGGDAGKAAVVLLVLAIVVLPVVTFSLVLSTPESEPNMSTSIDRVNLYNDLARSPGSPCAEPEPALEPPPPPPEQPAPEEP